VDSYSAQGAQAWITVLPNNKVLYLLYLVLPAITPMKAFTRWRIPRLRLQTSNCSLLLIYLPRKDERLSRPGCLTYSGRFTHISGHPSAAGRAQNSWESSPVKDQRLKREEIEVFKMFYGYRDRYKRFIHA